MSNYTEALREAYIAAAPEKVIYETLEFINSTTSDSLYLVRNYEDVEARLEPVGDQTEGDLVTFKAFGFLLELPPKNERGIGELTIEMDNVDNLVEDYINDAVETGGSITVRYRPYLADDLSAPDLSPPLSLEIKQISVNGSRITGRASFCQIVNAKFPTRYYTRSDFPSLGN